MAANIFQILFSCTLVLSSYLTFYALFSFTVLGHRILY